MGFPVFLNLRRISAKLAAVQKLRRCENIIYMNKTRDKLLLLQPQLLADCSFVSQISLINQVKNAYKNWRKNEQSGNRTWNLNWRMIVGIQNRSDSRCAIGWFDGSLVVTSFRNSQTRNDWKQLEIKTHHWTNSNQTHVWACSAKVVNCWWSWCCNQESWHHKQLPWLLDLLTSWHGHCRHSNVRHDHRTALRKWHQDEVTDDMIRLQVNQNPIRKGWVVPPKDSDALAMDQEPNYETNEDHV